MNSKDLKLVTDPAQRGQEKTPCLCPDGGGGEGTLLILEYPTVCGNCGNVATQRMSFVWKDTTAKHLDNLSMGASVKHYFTACDDCGSVTAG